MSTESRPTMYFETMSAEEIINYAESYSETALEKAMLRHMKLFADKEDREKESE